MGWGSPLANLRGPAGPAPSGTGVVKVSGGVLLAAGAIVDSDVSATANITEAKINRLRVWASVRRTVALNVPNNSATILDWIWSSVVKTDPYGFLTSGASNSLIVPTGFAGLYYIYSNVGFAAGSGAGYRAMRIKVNSNTIAQITQSFTSSTWTGIVSCVLPLADGDIVQLELSHTDGGNLALSVTANPMLPLLSLTRITV